ncbi:hypothetical protein HG531_011875 [Fusarium graminearum]|nr:hypothetical protein HG531_011875 [Fusarium graminearum]
MPDPTWLREYLTWFCMESPSREADALDSGLVNKPAAALASALVDKGTGQATFGIEDLLHDVLLAASSGDKCNADGVVNHGEGESDALGGRLGGILDRSDPGVDLAEQLVAREERAGMSVGSASEKEEVEDGQTNRIAAGEASNKSLLVLVGKFLRVVQVLGVDGMNGRLLILGELVQKLLLQKSIVGVFVVERYGTLVSEKDFPTCEIDDIVGTGRGGQEGLGECLGQRTTRDANLESTVSSNTGSLALNNVRAQCWGKSVCVAESEEVGLCFTHCDVVI